jgi:hypothetical protein
MSASLDDWCFAARSRVPTADRSALATMRVVRRALKQLAELGVVVASWLPFRDRL